VLALYEIHLTGRQRFGGRHVGLARNGGAKPQYLARVRYSSDDRLAVARTSRQLDAAGAKHENSARRLTFDEQHRALRKHRRVFECFERLYQLGLEVAEVAARSGRAGCATVADFQTVRCLHSVLPCSPAPFPSPAADGT